MVGTKTYRVEVSLSDLSNNCSSPLGGDCKHVVALLLFYLRNVDEVIDLVKLRDELKGRDKSKLIDIIIEAVRGNDVLLLIWSVDRKVRICTFLKVFNGRHLDEGVIQHMANIIRAYKNRISKQDLFKLLERAVDCEDFGCYYDDYRDNWFSNPLFEAIGEGLSGKELTREDVETLKKIIDRDEYQVTTPMILNLIEKAEADLNFLRLVEPILPRLRQGQGTR